MHRHITYNLPVDKMDLGYNYIFLFLKFHENWVRNLNLCPGFGRLLETALYHWTISVPFTDRIDKTWAVAYIDIS